MTADFRDSYSPSRLERARILELPESFYYIPNFISAEEEALLLAKINDAPATKWVNLARRRLQVYPAQLTPKNVLVLPPLSTARDASRVGKHALPEWLAQPILSRFEQLGVFEGTAHDNANHVLINEYKPQQGIMPHEDGEAYAPVTATVSLGAVGVLELFEKRADDETRESVDHESHGQEASFEERTVPSKKPRWRILQEERSLLVTRGDAYKSLMHGISEELFDEDLGPENIVNWIHLGDKERFSSGRHERGTRVSLTCRDVLKVSSVGAKLLSRR